MRRSRLLRCSDSTNTQQSPPPSHTDIHIPATTYLPSLYPVRTSACGASCQTLQKIYVKDAALEDVAARIGVEYDTPENKAKVGKSFQDLIMSCSTSSFMVRAPEYTEEGLAVLDKATRNVVRVRLSLGIHVVSALRGGRVRGDIRSVEREERSFLLQGYA